MPPPANIGMDHLVTTLEAATDAAEWHAAFIDVIETGFLSDRTPFGRLARVSLDTIKIRPGTIVPWPGTTANIPSGWLLCDGSQYPRGGYQDLVGAIGSTYGPYVGENFRLPDLRRKTVIGWSPRFVKPANSRGPDNRVGATSSDETVTLGSTTIPLHGHLLSASATGPDAGMSLTAVGSHTHTAYERTTFTSTPDRGHFAVRSDYLASNTSSTITDQADRHLHFIGGKTDKAGHRTPAPITISGSRVCMLWIIKT